MGDAAEEYLNECYAAGDDLAAEGHPMTTERTAPESCPNCIDESDCSNVEICRAVEAAYPPERTAEEYMSTAERSGLNAALTEARAEIERLRASQARLRSAIEFAHAEGFQWPSDPMAEFADQQSTLTKTGG